MLSVATIGSALGLLPELFKPMHAPLYSGADSPQLCWLGRYYLYTQISKKHFARAEDVLVGNTHALRDAHLGGEHKKQRSDYRNMY